MKREIPSRFVKCVDDQGEIQSLIVFTLGDYQLPEAPPPENPPPPPENPSEEEEDPPPEDQEEPPPDDDPPEDRPAKKGIAENLL
jgi:hypothetical protein